jgi:hypothetical protein
MKLVLAGVPVAAERGFNPLSIGSMNEAVSLAHFMMH